ncbi:MAG: hypothetical protein HYR85_07505 [Planctomycetes bacterium]|nr:hypothetical protein [Planctomycetota bacterium]MBI3848054.1 hypothetical protein [Planctomycetota bacterium]
MLRCISFAAIAVLAVAGSAFAQPVLTAPATAGPGDTVTWSVSGAAANARVRVLGSFSNAGQALGPFQLQCGSARVDLAIGPGLRFVGNGLTMPDGTFSRSITLPGDLPTRLNGATIYSQAVTVQLSHPPSSPGCTIITALSNVTTTTVHVP